MVWFIFGQVGTGQLFPVEIQNKEYCEYWIRPVFQTCLDLQRGRKEKMNIFLREGQFYEQSGYYLFVIF